MMLMLATDLCSRVSCASAQRSAQAGKARGAVLKPGNRYAFIAAFHFHSSGVTGPSRGKRIRLRVHKVEAEARFQSLVLLSSSLPLISHSLCLAAACLPPSLASVSASNEPLLLWCLLPFLTVSLFFPEQQSTASFLIITIQIT